MAGKNNARGQRIKLLRLEHCPGETAAHFAKRCGVHPVTLSKLEKGKQTPSIETYEKLAAGMGIPLARVVGE